MSTPIILAAIPAGSFLALLIAAYFAPVGFEDATGFHRTPSPCERDEDRASDVDAELDGGRLPTRIISHFHTTEVPRG